MNRVDKARAYRDALRQLWAEAEGTEREQIGGVIQELTSGETWRSIAELAERSLADTRARPETDTPPTDANQRGVQR